MSAPTISTCLRCGVASVACDCAEQRPVIDPSQVPCACCGEDDWCPEELALSAAEAEAAPELALGGAVVGRWW